MRQTWNPPSSHTEPADGKLVLALLVSCVLATALGAAEIPEAVSPGHDARHHRVEARCPTFSWGVVEGTDRYELVVYRVDAAEGVPELRLEESLPGSATTWTPALESCFLRGTRYAWSIRAVGEGQTSEWSPPKLFQVADTPGEALPGGVPDRAPKEAPRTEKSESVESAESPPELSRSPSPPRNVAAEATTDPLLDVAGGIAGTTIEATGAITSASSLSLDGSTDTITASSGTLSFADENLTTSGATTTAGLTVSGLDCSGNANGGALTADASGLVSCSDDEIGQIAADSLDFDDFADALTADATTTVDLDTNGADLDLDASTLFVDSSADRVGIGTAAPAVALDIVGDVAATGTITASGGIDLGTASLDQTPSDPALVGSVTLTKPFSVFVSGRYAYVADETANKLQVVDVSDRSAPAVVGSVALSIPRWVFVSGRYAYVGELGTAGMTIVDVSDPSSPAVVGSVVIGTGIKRIFVSGNYAYAISSGAEKLMVIDVSDPSAPTEVGSLTIGSGPNSVFVSGRYAYVADSSSDDLKVIDVSDPRSPTLAGSIVLGPPATGPSSVFVSGRYAYVVDSSAVELQVVDVSDPSSPTLAGTLGIGTSPVNVFVSGRYAYVVDSSDDELHVVDVADPSNLALVGSLQVGTHPFSLFVSGRHAYVTDVSSGDLHVIDVSGAEFSSAIAHSLEAGSLQVRESLITQGQLQVTGGATIGPGGLFSDGNVGILGTLALVPRATAPSTCRQGEVYVDDSGAFCFCENTDTWTSLGGSGTCS